MFAKLSHRPEKPSWKSSPGPQFVTTVSWWIHLTNARHTCLSSSLSSRYCLAAWFAVSAWAWRASVVDDTDASWFIRVTTRFITLQKDQRVNKKVKRGWRKSECVICRAGMNSGKNSQPEEDSKPRDVEVPLCSEQLHVHVIVHVWQQLGVFTEVFARVFPYFTHSIWKRQNRMSAQRGMIFCSFTSMSPTADVS